MFLYLLSYLIGFPPFLLDYKKLENKERISMRIIYTGDCMTNLNTVLQLGWLCVSLLVKFVSNY